ncbi:MAG TPA: hypothetical protein VNE67_17200 [Acetobacteraceae bacterium]|nr:hypothetical protein [Stellaceae bacterium]HVB69588.1 hypothetical protein [Acetobacteraceae bacterium]
MMGFPFIEWGPPVPRARRPQDGEELRLSDARRYPMLAAQRRCGTGYTALPAPAPKPLWSGPLEPPRIEDIWG